MPAINCVEKFGKAQNSFLTQHYCCKCFLGVLLKIYPGLEAGSTLKIEKLGLEKFGLVPPLLEATIDSNKKCVISWLQMRSSLRRSAGTFGLTQA